MTPADRLAAPRVAAHAQPETATSRELTAEFEALLFKEAFAPLSKAMGFYGDAVVTAAATAMTRSFEPIAREDVR